MLPKSSADKKKKTYLPQMAKIESENVLSPGKVEVTSLAGQMGFPSKNDKSDTSADITVKDSRDGGAVS
jgi:hypothetical protein